MRKPDLQKEWDKVAEWYEIHPGLYTDVLKLLTETYRQGYIEGKELGWIDERELGSLETQHKHAVTGPTPYDNYGGTDSDDV